MQPKRPHALGGFFRACIERIQAKDSGSVVQRLYIDAYSAMPNLEQIYPLYVNMVFRICSRYCMDRSEAEDLTQETFLQVEKGLPRFRGDAELETWIYRICTNCCLAYLRTKQRRKKLQVLYLDSQVISNLNPDSDRVLAKIDLDRILSQFSATVRHILFLTLAEGLSYREAGEVLGISPSAAAKVVGRFLKKFLRDGGITSPNASLPSKYGQRPGLDTVAGLSPKPIAPVGE